MSHPVTFGTARHPFRATLPLRVLRRLPQYEPEVRARMTAALAATTDMPDEAQIARPGKPLLTMQEVKDFLLAYCACFMAVSAFLS